MAKPSSARKKRIKKLKPVRRLKKGWWVYLLECRGGAVYTGISTDVERRVAEHNAGTGSKALRGKRPVKLIYCEKSPDRSRAQRREAEIKRWPPAKKRLLAVRGE